MEELTKRQEQVLNFIKEFKSTHGFPPTVREIGNALDMSSPATTQAHLTNLENKGFIKRQNSKNRSIELLVDNEFEMKDDQIVNVPLLGKITAGSPIEAIEQPGEFFSLPAYLIPNNKEVFTKFATNLEHLRVNDYSDLLFFVFIHKFQRKKRQTIFL